MKGGETREMEGEKKKGTENEGDSGGHKAGPNQLPLAL